MAEAKKDNVIESAIEFLDKVKSEDSVTIKFKKKDGSDRTMKCTLNFDKIPKSDHPKGVNLSKILKMLMKDGLLHVYDIDKKGWRSVTYNAVEWLQTPSKLRYKIKR